MKITQTYQFAQLRPLPKRQSIADGKSPEKQFDTILRDSGVIDGRPTLKDLQKAKRDGFNYVWLYTKIDRRPELVDGIELG